LPVTDWTSQVEGFVRATFDGELVFDEHAGRLWDFVDFFAGEAVNVRAFHVPSQGSWTTVQEVVK
jgi:hypothetical protein